MRNSDDPPLEPEMPNYSAMELGELTAACEAKGIDTDRRGGDYMVKQLEATHGIRPTAA